MSALANRRALSQGDAVGWRLARFQRAQSSREIVLLYQEHSRIVVDRELFGHGDARLIARLESDEPDDNAALLAALYQATSRDCCLVGQELPVLAETRRQRRLPARLVDQNGRRYWLANSDDGQLRWVTHHTAEAEIVVCTLRTVVGALEAYEPAIGISERRLAGHPRRATLAGEITKLRNSVLVLNRGLREAVLQAVHGGTLSLSEIALRCGRIRRQHGVPSGETSWLARRVGLLGGGGDAAPTPWIHTDVLAVISRNGLGLSPREVELEAFEPVGEKRRREPTHKTARRKPPSTRHPQKGAKANG